jgi:ABC-2 type transport system permease protein
VAEPTTADGLAEAAAPLPRSRAEQRPLPGLLAYLLLVRMWSRSASQYRVSLALTGLAQVFTTCLDLIAILVIYSQVPMIGGFALAQTLYLYGTTRLAFGLSDLLASGVETLADSIRLGTFDTVLIRPVSTLAQVLADQFAPKRFGKLVPAIATLIWAVVVLPVQWNAMRIIVCCLTVVCGFVIYCALWVLSGCIGFIAVDAREVANTFTYGSEFATEYPITIFGAPLGLALTFVLPVAFVTWQPALYVLGRPDPFGLPGFLRFASPVAALVLSGLAALAWRACVRRYRSTGS